MQETETQAALAGLERLWMEVLGVDAIDGDDDFFDLGGHSLSAVQLSILIRDELNLTVLFSEILQNPVYAALQEVIRHAPASPADTNAKPAGASS